MNLNGLGTCVREPQRDQWRHHAGRKKKSELASDQYCGRRIAVEDVKDLGIVSELNAQHVAQPSARKRER
jgi:hypothetical protein